MNVDQTLSKIDTMLDDIEELIRELPINAAVKKQLASQVYGLWMDIEEQVEDQLSLNSTDFG
jgi:c-di-GMP-related signal transduction protein